MYTRYVLYRQQVKQEVSFLISDIHVHKICTLYTSQTDGSNIHVHEICTLFYRQVKQVMSFLISDIRVHKICTL